MTNYNAPNSLTNNKPSPGSSYNAPFNVNSYHLGTIKPEYKPTSSLPIDANGFGMG